jgi:hypothetical protein
MQKEILLLFDIFRLQLNFFLFALAFNRLREEQILGSRIFGRRTLVFTPQEVHPRFTVFGVGFIRGFIFLSLFHAMIFHKFVSVSSNCSFLALNQAELIDHFFCCLFCVVLANFRPLIVGLVLMSNLPLALLLNSKNARLIFLCFAKFVFLKLIQITSGYFCFQIHLSLQAVSSVEPLILIAHSSEVAVFCVSFFLVLLVSLSFLHFGDVLIKCLVALGVLLRILILCLSIVTITSFFQGAKLSGVEFLNFVLKLFECLLLFCFLFVLAYLFSACLVQDVKLVFADRFVLGHTVFLPVCNLGGCPHFPINITRENCGIEVLGHIRIGLVVVFFRWVSSLECA